MLGKHGTGRVEHERPARIGQRLLSLLALLQLQSSRGAVCNCGNWNDVVQKDAHAKHDIQHRTDIIHFEHCHNY
jgi:hypothetical protein